MPGHEDTVEMVGGENGDVSAKRLVSILNDGLSKQTRLFRYIADRDKPNLFWEGNNGALSASNDLDLEVFVVPSASRLLIGRLIILADGKTPGANKYTNAGAYWQLFEGANRNQLAMPDFGPLDGSISGSSQIPLVNAYGTKGMPFEAGTKIRIYINAPTLTGNIAVMFLGWLEPPYPDSQ